MESKRSTDSDDVAAKSPTSKDAPNPGRRRRERKPDDAIPNEAESKEAVDPGSKPRRPRNRGGEGATGGGWMSSDGGGGNSSATKKLSLMSMDDDDVQEALQVVANKDKHFQETEGDVLEIPDLDEEAGINVDQRVAHAPKNVTRKIPTLTELDEEVATAIPSQEDGLNMSILTSTLVPAALLYEADVLWTFESLLREVTEEISELPKPATKAATGANTTVKTAKAPGKKSG